MKIEIPHIPSQGTTLAYKKDAKEFAVLKELDEQGECRIDEPLLIELRLIPERDMIKLKGLITATAHLVCSRCLVDYRYPIHHKFTLRFSKQIPTDIHADADGQIELTADQIGLIYFEGEEIDFYEPVQEQIVLALPIKPLCREDCKGLCPRCGADLNEQPCNCGEDRSSSPFAILTQQKWPSKQTEK